MARELEKPKQERKKRQANTRVVSPPEGEDVGQPLDVFNNVVKSVNSSTQWLEGTPDTRAKLLEKSLAKVMKANPRWFNNAFPTMTPASNTATKTVQQTVAILEHAKPTAKTSDQVPLTTHKDTLTEDIVREFFLARSDVRVQVGLKEIKLLKQKKNTLFAKSVVISYAGLYKLAEITNTLKVQHSQRAERLKDGFIYSEPDFMEILDALNNVYAVVSCYEGHPLIHVRRYFSHSTASTSQSTATPRLVPTKSGVTITVSALVDLRNRVVPLMLKM